MTASTSPSSMPWSVNPGQVWYESDAMASSMFKIAGSVSYLTRTSLEASSAMSWVSATTIPTG